jgi:hypothetical protein
MGKDRKGDSASRHRAHGKDSLALNQRGHKGDANGKSSGR